MTAEIIPDTSRLLMSDVLKGTLADASSDEINQLEQQYVLIIADRLVADQHVPVTGIMVSMLFDLKPEVEMKVTVTDALDIIEAQSQRFDGFELHHGERIVPIKGPFSVVAARILDVEAKTQMCHLLLQLERLKKA